MVDASAKDILTQHALPERTGTYAVEISRHMGRLTRVLGAMGRAEFARAVGGRVAQQTGEDVTVWTGYKYLGDSADPEQWPANITIGEYPVLPADYTRILWPPQPEKK
jgi:hypothetical protein